MVIEVFVVTGGGTLKPSIAYPLFPSLPLASPCSLLAPCPMPQIEVVGTLQPSMVVWTLKYSMVVETLKPIIKCPHPLAPLLPLTSKEVVGTLTHTMVPTTSFGARGQRGVRGEGSEGPRGSKGGARPRPQGASHLVELSLSDILGKTRCSVTQKIFSYVLTITSKCTNFRIDLVAVEETIIEFNRYTQHW